MKSLVLLSFGMLLCSASSFAFPADGCEQQRNQYPAKWNDVSKEKGIYDCHSHYDGNLRIKLGATDAKGNTLMSLVPAKYSEGGDLVERPELGVLRIWLDKEQTARLLEGKYFGTVVRKENSCWIRGDLSGDQAFFMDNANPPSDSPDSGSLYNKAPRVTIFGSSYYDCERIK